MSFLGFNGDGIMQQDIVGSTFAQVDVCQDICSIGSGLFIGAVTFEQFTSTIANAVFVNNGTADILLDQYTVSVPGVAVPPRIVDTAVLLPGGRCTNAPSAHCGLDNDCGVGSTCDHAETSVQVLLFDLVDKALALGDQTCPMLDTSTTPFTVTNGNVTPFTLQTNVKFHGSDETGKSFSVNAGLVATFGDANNCTTSSGGTP